MIEYLTLSTSWVWVSPWFIAALQYLQTPTMLWSSCSARSAAPLGGLQLALKGKHADVDWVLFAFSNAGWIVFANGHGHGFLLIQQVGFPITSATRIGIWKYLISPRVDNLFDIFTPSTSSPELTGKLR